jgi:TRAP-type C4-dicarboxylate transport system substrate-binding protein
MILRDSKLRHTDEQDVHSDVQGAGCRSYRQKYGELFAALQQGTVDGQENLPMFIVSARVQEVQKFMTFMECFL